MYDIAIWIVVVVRSGWEFVVVVKEEVEQIYAAWQILLL